MVLYTTTQKSAYRVAFWKAVDQSSSLPRSARVAVVLEDTGLEVEYLISLGYSPDSIIAVNRSAAKLAHVTRRLDRLGLPRVKTVSGDFVRVVECLPGRLDVVNFDTCNALGKKLLSDFLRLTGRCRVIGLNVVAAHTYDCDNARIHAVFLAARQANALTVRWGKYVNPCGSGRTPMLWFCIKRGSCSRNHQPVQATKVIRCRQ